MDRLRAGVPGRRIPLADPGRSTQLFFLDEATALAAGHRPCGECRRPAFHAYLDAWRIGSPAEAPAGIRHTDDVDRVLHRQRTGPWARARLHALPDGTFAARDGDPRPLLVLGGALLAWHPHGYGDRVPRTGGVVEVLTPRSTVEALRAGYRPVLHPSARS